MIKTTTQSVGLLTYNPYGLRLNGQQIIIGSDTLRLTLAIESHGIFCVMIIHCTDAAVYQLPVDGRFTCSGEITKYKLCLTNNWTRNITVTLVRFREVQISNSTVASTGVAHAQLVLGNDSLAGQDFLGDLRRGSRTVCLSFSCNDFLGYTIPSRLVDVLTAI